MPTARQIKAAEIVVELRAKTAELEQAMGKAKGAVSEFKNHSNREMTEAKHAVALLGDEIGVRVPRELRGVLVALPGVTQAVNAAFSAIAVIGFVNIVVEAAQKLNEFIKKNEEAATKNREAWDKIGDNLTGYADNLRISNDKLDETIAKLEHKPVNGMKLAIDESVQSATTLGQKLKEDLGLISETLEKQKVTFLSELFGNAGTGDLKEKVDKLREALSELSSQERDALKDAKPEEVDGIREKFSRRRASRIGLSLGDVTGEINRAQAIQDANKAAIKEAAARPGVTAVGGYIAITQTGAPAGLDDNQTERLRQLKELRDKLETISDINDLENEHREKQGTADKLQKAQEAKDAFERSNAERLEQLQKELADKKYHHQVILSEEAVFWTNAVKTLDVGSKAYAQAQQHAAELSERVAENYHTRGAFTTKLHDELKRQAEEAPKAVDTTRGADEIDRANLRDVISQAQAAAAYQLTADKLALATGAINAHQAAVDVAAAHTTEYQAKLAALRYELEKLHQNDWMGDHENTAKEIGLQTAINDLNSQYKVQALTDAQGVLSTTWKGMIDDVFDEVIAGSQHATDEVRSISSGFIQSMNGELAKVITNQHFDFSNVFRTGATSLAKLGLNTIEGSILKGLGLGKRDGSTQGQALWVQMADNAFPISDSIGKLFSGGPKPNVTGPGGANALTNLAGKGLLGFLNNSNFFTKGFLGNFFGAGGVWGAGHALGGDVMGGVPITVGELGPETFVPPSNGKIVPHNQTTGASGDIHIDARGTDPSLTRENVFRAMQAARQAGAHDAVRGMYERQRRTAR